MQKMIMEDSVNEIDVTTQGDTMFMGKRLKKKKKKNKNAAFMEYLNPT